MEIPHMLLYSHVMIRWYAIRTRPLGIIQMMLKFMAGNMYRYVRTKWKMLLNVLRKVLLGITSLLSLKQSDLSIVPMSFSDCDYGI